ncbi:peroxidase family protein [Stieleria varia]|uniref:Peroxidase n=1 Tax=Stieleria varia TaxID=2528005 RepID=A0A5C6B6U3_9BACT|nr:peroxidase family protein [Stieleria varia]TWU08015.1 peroxidase [Stieleria varia]
MSSPKNSSKRQPTQKSPWSVSALEARMMLAGDVAPAIASSCSGETTPACVSTDIAEQTHSEFGSGDLVIIDPSISDVEQLTSGISPHAEIVFLNPEQPGLQQITQILQSHREIRSIHLFAHGRSGEIQLGNQRVNESTLQKEHSQLNQWRDSLSSDADILIYSCETGKGTAGADFIQRLAALTGADVAASIDLTGNQQQGGDWELERQVGKIETAVAIDATTRRDYRHVLQLSVIAAGATGEEIFSVEVAGEKLGTFQATTEMQTYQLEIDPNVSFSDVRVVFENDLYDEAAGYDRNLIVDKVLLDGVSMETEDARVFSTGTWTADLGILPGFRQTQQLHANGFLQYGFSTIGEVARMDGKGNNLENQQWGTSGDQFLRLADPAYADGLNQPARQDQPDGRSISDQLSSQTESVENDRFISSVWFQWGQFIDHDITRSFSLDRSLPVESFDINDQFAFNRSAYDLSTGVDSPREQINHITAFIDGSMVYGDEEGRASVLRQLSGGRMWSIETEHGELLPPNHVGLPNAAPPTPEFFVAGDVRVNENIELTAMQTLFLREHNRIADELAATEFADRDLDDPAVDEEIFQRARQYVSGLIQHITYNEFLPSTLGFSAIETYQGYDSTVNPQISNEFATAAFRLGHSTLADQLIVDRDGNTITLAEAFSNPRFVMENGIDGILEGITRQKMQEVDLLVVDGLRNALNDGPDGFDLVARNIQRGRDHGLADYNTIRQSIGLGRVESFYEIMTNEDVAAKLESIYGSPDNADPWVAMIAEDHVPGSSVGETIHAIMVDQFTRLRNGDRFYFENQMSDSQIAEIKSTRLSDIITRNTNAEVQSEVFWTPDTLVFRNGLDNEWLIRDFGDNGGAEVVFFGQQGVRDPDDRTETIPVQRDTPVNAVVVAGINENSDGFFIPNALVPVPQAELGVDEFIVTADIEFFEGYGLGGNDRWVIQSDVASVFASGDDGDDTLSVTASSESEIRLTGGNGIDRITVDAPAASLVDVDGGSSVDDVDIHVSKQTELILRDAEDATITYAEDKDTGDDNDGDSQDHNRKHRWKHHFASHHHDSNWWKPGSWIEYFRSKSGSLWS